MDVGLYREDEQFSFTTSVCMDWYLNNSTHYPSSRIIDPNEMLGDLRPMSQPPNEIFEWHNDDRENKLNCDVDTVEQSEDCSDDGELDESIDTKHDVHQMLGLEKWQSVWQPPINLPIEQIPVNPHYIAEESMHSRNPANLHDLLEIPDLPITKLNLGNIITEDNISTAVLRPSETVANTLNENNCRRDSESSDLLNVSFSSTELTNFDITEYVFEENKQATQSIEGFDTKKVADSEPFIKADVSKRSIKAGVKKIDLKAQRYIIETDTKKLLPEDEYDIDIETVPEEGNSLILEASNVADLLVQFEATEVQNKEHLSNGKYSNSKQEDLSLNVKVEIKSEKHDDAVKIIKPVVKQKTKVEKKQLGRIKPPKVKQKKLSARNLAGNLNNQLKRVDDTQANNKERINNGKWSSSNQENSSLNTKVQVKVEKEDTIFVNKPIIKEEPEVEKKQIGTTNWKTKLLKIKQEKLDSSDEMNIEPETNLSQTREVKQISQEHLYINDTKVHVQPTETGTTTSSKTLSASSSRRVLDSLPQELINRIRESGKRKPITVIQAIPNNRKKTKVQEPAKTLSPVSPEIVRLDHNYCSNSSNPKNKINNNNSGSLSADEDDRAIISRQPTVKNADGTLMVSLLKVNTIHQLDPRLDSTKNQKKKLNLEEYKKRRYGVLTPKSISQNSSPSMSTCSSPRQEDAHQRMLKHQEKLRKMAQELLNAAPKSEKKSEVKLEVKPEIKPSNISDHFSPSPSPSTVLISQPASPASCKGVVVKIEPSNKKIIEPTKAKFTFTSVVPDNIPIKIEPPKVPPNLERIVLVSFGINTDFRIAKDENPLAPVEVLQGIKPLLEKASSKINEHSLIASVIENIPKVINKSGKPEEPRQTDDCEHGEYKQIIYLEKDRVRCESKDAATQTNISLIEQSKCRRKRRVSSSSSTSSYRSTKSTRRRSRERSCSSSSSHSSLTSRCSTLSGRWSEFSSRYSSRLSYSRSRSRSPKYNRRRRSSSAEREHMNAVEERRIIYIGKISTGTTKEDLRRKFNKFGPISKISLHFRDIGENYGFVTFRYKEDAHEAYEHGNDDSAYPRYKISFGGRREFCKAAYSDLDNMRDDSYYQSQRSGDSYDQLLKETLEKLKKRKA